MVLLQTNFKNLKLHKIKWEKQLKTAYSSNPLKKKANLQGNFCLCKH